MSMTQFWHVSQNFLHIKKEHPFFGTIILRNLSKCMNPADIGNFSLPLNLLLLPYFQCTMTSKNSILTRISWPTSMQRDIKSWSNINEFQISSQQQPMPFMLGCLFQPRKFRNTRYPFMKNEYLVIKAIMFLYSKKATKI